MLRETALSARKKQQFTVSRLAGIRSSSALSIALGLAFDPWFYCIRAIHLIRHVGVRSEALAGEHSPRLCASSATELARLTPSV